MSDSVVSSGMTVSGLTVDGGSSLTVLSGGLAVDTTVSSGSADIVAGVTSDTLLQAFATETVLSGGQALHTSVGSAAAQFISGGGVASATAIGSGGEVYVLSYGLAQAAVVEAGGLLVVSSGGTAVATDIASGGTVQLQDFAVASGGRIERGGAEVVLSDGETIDDRIEAGGFLVVSSGGAATSADVASGGFLVISAGGIADDAVVHSGGMEVISAGGSAVDTLLEAGGGIDLDAIGFAADGTATLDRDTDILTIDENGTETELQLAGDYDGIYFRLSADGDGSTIVTADGTPCYCPGTLIETERGEVPVERLRIGDRLRTASGALRPLRWIGRRSYDGRFAAGRADILPVVVRAGALGGGLPRRDLFVSPLHALFLDGMLVPAAALLNGNSIVQAAAVDTVEYIHLEFDEHDVILAEGAPAESFVDDDSRGMFHNAHEFAALYPDAPPVSARYCAPRLEAGERLEALRRRLAEHAMPYPARPEIPIDGRLDAADHHTVRGWVRGVPGGGPVRLRILDNNRTVAVVDAVPAGPDPLDGGAARGGTPPDRDRLGFAFVVPGGLDPTRRHVLQVQTLPGQRELPGSPVFLDPVAAVGTPEAVPALPAPVASADAEPDCRGHLDRVRRGLVTGWAWNAATPGEAVAVQLFSGGRLLCRVVANAFRPDLLAAGIGDGRHGFSVDLGAELSPLDRHVVHARIERTGRELAGSPAVVEPADRFDGALEGVVSGAVDALRDPDRERAVLDFLRTQCDRLGQRIADNSARRDERERVREARRALGPAAARMAPPPPRALVIDERMPSPDRDAGSAAILSHVSALRRLGYEVSVAAAEAGWTDDGNTAAVRAVGAIPCDRACFGTVEELLRRQSGCFDVVYLHRVGIAAAYGSLVRRTMPRARLLYGVADLHHLRFRRQAAVQNRPELLGLANRVRLEECTAAWQADAVLTHSGAEAELLRRMVPGAKVYEVPWAFTPRDEDEAGPGFTERSGLVFLGNYGHEPNEDAARWLVEELMPLVWARQPGLTCILAGRDMTPRIHALGRPGVEILGAVSELRPLWDRVRLSVAPLRFGAGVKGKVLDSFAAGVPCVMTPVAAEGLELPPSLSSWVAAESRELAELILRMHDDRGAHLRARVAGLDLLRDRHDESDVAEALLAAIEGRPPATGIAGTAPAAA